MNYFKLLAAILALSFISNCTPPANNTGGAEVSVRDNYDDLISNDPDRTAVLEASKKRKSGSICEDEEDKKHECKELCDEIYSRRSDEQSCQELTIPLIEAIYEVFELLENPRSSRLDGIDTDDFNAYINVSIASLDKLVKKWSKSETREFLYWLINDEEVAAKFIDQDEDYETFSAMLEELVSFTKADIHKPFTAKIEEGDLMEVAVNSGNDEIIEWFMGYIEEENSACSTETVSKACFTVYCRIGKGIDDDAMEELLDYDEFSDYIEDIIDDKINATNGVSPNINAQGWTHGDGNNEIDDIDDIEDDWTAQLCRGIS